MSDEILDGDDDEILDLAALAGEVTRRGRKSEVDPAIVARLAACETGQGFFFPGSDMAGADFDRYMADKGKPRAKDDGKLESREEAMRRATNAWQQRQRQRALATATAAGIDKPYLRWHTNGKLVVGRAS